VTVDGDSMIKEQPEQAYRTPPIVEAMMDVRLVNEIGPKGQDAIVKKLKVQYPHAQPLQTFNINIDATGGSVDLQQQLQGFRLASDDQSDVVIVMPNGVTVARLAPYPGWPVLYERMEAVWKALHKSVAGARVVRLGVRTINRIDIPLANQPVISLQNYLNFYPNMPPISPSAMIGFMMQVTIPTRSPRWLATITSTLITPAPMIDHLSLLLDIDLARTEDISTSVTDLPAEFGEARGLKNDIFEQCITDETRRLIA
jgi:uncharacterized protein (TIGR04255 family)